MTFLFIFKRIDHVIHTLTYLISGGGMGGFSSSSTSTTIRNGKKVTTKKV